MNKKTLFFLIAALLSMASAFAQVSVWDGTHTTWTKGAGTEANPYLLENAAQLAHLAYYVNSGTNAVDHVVGCFQYWKLTTDIDLNVLPWTPIGYINADNANDHYEFGGHFDGSGHTVANLFTSGTTQSTGLFGRMNGGSVKNIGIVGNSSITGTTSTGGIVGWCTGTLIFENCYNTGSVSSTISNAGGIIGCINTGYVAINNCFNTGYVYSTSSDVTSAHQSGGIVGFAIGDGNLTINNCYNTGYIHAATSSTRVGGIVGYANNNGNLTISNCHNTGNILAATTMFSSCGGAGIIGMAVSKVTIDNCYNTGNVSSSNTFSAAAANIAYAAGIIGWSTNTITTNNCYNTGEISASASSSHYDEPKAFAAGITGWDIATNTIYNCYNTGDISSFSASSHVSPSAEANAGGITSAGNANINNCYNTGNISTTTTTRARTGGIAGTTIAINNCYNTGNIFTSTASTSPTEGSVGGIAGYSGNINNCYNTGEISFSTSAPSYTYAGGIVGDGGTVNNSYYLAGSASNPGGGISLTAEFMKIQPFVDYLNNGPAPNSAYKLDNIHINNGYPILLWQKNNAIATLSTLTVSAGTLTPAFSSNIYDYSVEVANSVTELTISATATDAGATVTGAGVKQIAVGANPFTITVTAADGVTKLNYTVTVNRVGVGIVETHNCASLRVYPNPTTGVLNLIQEHVTRDALYVTNVEVFDVYGNRHTSLVTCNENTINISNLAAGIYFLKVENEIIKIVKQ